MTVFEVKKNKAGKWFYHSLDGGNILARSAPYYSRWNAKRAALVRSEKSPGSRVTVLD